MNQGYDNAITISGRDNDSEYTENSHTSELNDDGISFEEIQKELDGQRVELEKEILSIQKCALEDEVGAAKIAKKEFEGKYLYNHTANVWITYKDGLWKPDRYTRIREEVPEYIKALILEESKKIDDQIMVLFKQNTKNNDDEIQALGKLRDELRKKAHQLNKRSVIDNFISLLQPRLPVSSTDFDTNPLLLNLPNGTFCFATNTLKPHHATDLLSKQVQISYDSKASCPKWIQFLNFIFIGDASLIRFIQKILGYSLTGLTDIQAVFFCYGKGQNGKSTFFAVIQMLLGDYFASIPIESLLAKPQHDATVEYQMVKLKGARLSLSTEMPKNRRLNESLIKDLTGGELINARNPREKPFYFPPTHKLWMFGNHKPIIKGTDEGIWRRIKMIPFLAKVADDQKRDMSEMIEEFRQELPGILKWAIEGFYDYKKNGLQVPEIVDEETAKLRGKNDALMNFLSERCVQGKFIDTAKKLYEGYQKWCNHNEEESAFDTDRKLYAALEERGYEKFNDTKNKNAVSFKGLRLKTDEELEKEDELRKKEASENEAKN